MNIADIVEEVKRKKEFDFFSKVAYICDNFGKDILTNSNKTEKDKANYYRLPEGEHGEWNFIQHFLPENDVMIHEGSAFFHYNLDKKDYPSRKFNPVIPERWEKMVDEILKNSK
jgi:hypothetical protein